jgi:hypothetical protein
MQLYCMQLARLEETGRLTATIASLAKLNNTRKARQVIAEALPTSGVCVGGKSQGVGSTR